MSEEILPDVIDSGTSKEAWDKLQRMFRSATRARVVQIRVDLATAKKGDLSARDYFSRIKGLASELVAANSPISDDEVIVYLLAGLGPDCDSFFTSMTTKDALALDEVYAHLMTFEARLLKHHSDQQLRVASTVHFAGRGGPFRGHGRSRGSGRFPPSRGDVPSRSLVIVAPRLSARPARYVAGKATLPFTIGIVWMKLIMKTPRTWLLRHHIRLIQTGILTRVLLIILLATLIA